MAAPILQVKDLKTQFFTDDGVVKAVNGVSFDLYPGETLGIVGESGCGKSVTALSILRLVQEPGRIVNGQILFKGDDIVTMSDEEVREIRGKDIAMIFQDTLSSLNPVLTVGFQIEEAIEAHGKVPGKMALSRAVALLKQVRIPAAESRVHDYPHQFSGGMRQRAMIAMGLANSPSILIADEPTTALDVTVQAQILELPPDLIRPPRGCRFHPRCQFKIDRCLHDDPPLLNVGPDQDAACWVTMRRALASNGERRG